MNKIANGKPLQVFGLIMLGWLAIRIVSVNSNIGLIEQEDVEALENTRPALAGRALAGRALAASKALVAPEAFAAEIVRAVPPPPAAYKRNTTSRQRGIETPTPLFRHSVGEENVGEEEYARHPGTDRLAVSSFVKSDKAEAGDTQTTSSSPPPVMMVPLSQKRGDRWRGSAWALWREGSATRADAVTGGRLGGSQSGLRIDLDLTPDAHNRTAAYGRVSAAMTRPASPEGAIGIAWQPARSVPISLAAERRIALGKGARNANAVLAVGGFGPKPVVASLQAEGYAQTGMVGFRSNDLFVDGKLSVLSRISKAPVRVGASVSGGAQPQVERLDIGPEVQLRLPLPRAAARLSIEWRERVAGLAAPTSGLAVTLGGDF